MEDSNLLNPDNYNQSAWHDQEMTGEQSFQFAKFEVIGYDEQGNPVAASQQDAPTRQALENITRKLNEKGIPVNNPGINWHEEHERFDQINRVLDYCTEQGICPDDLIDFHKVYHTQPIK